MRVLMTVSLAEVGLRPPLFPKRMAGVCYGAGYLSAAGQFVDVLPLSQALRTGSGQGGGSGHSVPVRRDIGWRALARDPIQWDRSTGDPA